MKVLLSTFGLILSLLSPLIYGQMGVGVPYPPHTIYGINVNHPLLCLNQLQLEPSNLYGFGYLGCSEESNSLAISGQQQLKESLKECRSTVAIDLILTSELDGGSAISVKAYGNRDPDGQGLKVNLRHEFDRIVYFVDNGPRGYFELKNEDIEKRQKFTFDFDNCQEKSRIQVWISSIDSDSAENPSIDTGYTLNHASRDEMIISYSYVSLFGLDLEN